VPELAFEYQLFFTAGANADGDSDVGQTVSSPTLSTSTLIRDVVTQLLQQYIDGGLRLDIPLSMYASSLAVSFYDQQLSHSAGGTVALTDNTLAELSAFVRNNIELRSRRSSL